ncbi:TPA: hypothetical protein DCS99_00905 [Candidatus Wolfebacteria bacterium]|nr:hypothetical protein [Candidatus Wolfebacteria bacterium]
MSTEKKERVNILSIETSCDETALSFVTASGGLEKPTFTVHGDVVASQIKLHQPYGGVVPALAKRAHLENLPLLFAQVVRGGVTPAEAGVQIKINSGLRRNDNLYDQDYFLNVRTVLIYHVSMSVKRSLGVPIDGTSNPLRDLLLT